MPISGSTTAETHESDAFGHIEARGIDYVPASERHGRPLDLFWVWMAANVNYLYVILGGLLTILGLTIWQALVVVLIGNLFWAVIGFLAISGPAAGAPSSVITRSMFGIRGNRIFVGVFNWPVFIAYEAINLALGAVAGFALAAQLGLSTNRPTQIAVVVVTAAVTLAISVYGHATIVRMSGVFTAVLTLGMLVLGGFVIAHADWNYVVDPSWAPTGGAVWATAIAGVTIIAAAPLSWGISADYARYLPESSSKVGIATWTALGGFIPSVALGAIGVLAGTVVDMNDPQTSLAAILPGWFYAIFLLMITIGCVTNNVLTMYSSGLCLQAVGIPLSRSITVFIDGILGVALACYALFVSDFTSTLSSVLELSVAVLGPSVAIYAADIVLRRNRYDGLALQDESRGSAFWFHGGVNIAGMTALVLGSVGAALCLSTTAYVGPVAARLAGADLSTIVGPVIAIVVYVVLDRLIYAERESVATGGRVGDPLGVHSSMLDGEGRRTEQMALVGESVVDA